MRTLSPLESLARMVNGPADVENLLDEATLADLRDRRWQMATNHERQVATATAKAILSKFDLTPKKGSREAAYIGVGP